MASAPREDVVDPSIVAIYHVWSRTVRQAWLCGYDPLTGKDYSEWRQWIREFLEELAGLFGVEVGFHAEMSNHLHLVLRSRPDVVQTWSDQEVVRRSMTIERLAKSKTGKREDELPAGEITLQARDPERVAELRLRLSHVSHFMKTLGDYIGRRANREDECKGRFFEERFSCRRLFDEAAVLVCGVYVDLNQIRAGETLTPEESKHTSAYERILDRLCEDMFGESLRIDSADSVERLSDKAGWMCELTLQEGPDADVSALNCTKSKRRASEKGLLPVSLRDYLSLLDWTGKQQRAGKAGAIPSEYADIMDRLHINRTMWMDLTCKFDQLFGSLVGNAASIASHVAAIGRTRCKGQATCSAAFG